MFSDSVYGGKEAARRAARKFKKSAIAKVARGTVKSGGKKASSRKKTTSRRAPSRGRRGRTTKRARR